jgi:hypothetical protein
MEKVNKGKNIVITLIVIVLLFEVISDVSVISIYVARGKANLASSELIQDITRLILTILLMYFLYKGHSWAKWITVVLFMIGGLLGLVSMLSSFNVIILLLSLVYIAVGVIMITSSSVNEFLRYQRGIY